MAFEITENMQNASENVNLTPQLVLEIEGVTTVYTGVEIQKIIRINDPDLFVGLPCKPGEPDVWTIGGLCDVDDQSNLISFQSGTSTQIRQSLLLDKGKGETVSSMQIALVDSANEVTKLVSPGNVVEDVLFRRAKIWLGFEGTAWKDDFIVIFRGIIDDVDSGAGLITLNIAHPDQKKRSRILEAVESELSAGIGAGDTSLMLDSADGFLQPISGPSGSVDTSLKFYLRINDEIMRYETIGGTLFGTITRGELGTTASAHSAGDTATAFYTIEGNAIDIALKLMLSGVNGDYLEDEPLTNIGAIGPATLVGNALWFDGINIEQEHGVVLGDYVTVTGASNGANNFSGRQITEIVREDTGSYVVVDGADLVTEFGTSAVVSIRSQYDVWPTGAGLNMIPDEVDVVEHLSVKSIFLGSISYEFRIDETISDGKEFLSEEIYNPAAAFSIPRNARSSVGVHSPPLPTQRVKQFDIDNVINPSDLKIRRTTVKNFHNTIVTRFDKETLEDRFLKNVISASQTSIDRIPAGIKALEINSRGLRSTLTSNSVIDSANQRRLRKFQFGAEEIKNAKVNFKTGFDMEIGDILLFDMTSLQVSDIQSGTRAGEARLFQVVNKTFDIKTGNITLAMVDTNFDKDVRYGLISPCSRIKSASSETSVTIENAGTFSEFGPNEFKKWRDFAGIGAVVQVRSADFTTVGTATLVDAGGNTLTLGPGLGFTPTAGMLMEFADYDQQPDEVKLIYAYMSDVVFADGKTQYLML